MWILSDNRDKKILECPEDIDKRYSLENVTKDYQINFSDRDLVPFVQIGYSPRGSSIKGRFYLRHDLGDTVRILKLTENLYSLEVWTQGTTEGMGEFYTSVQKRVVYFFKLNLDGPEWVDKESEEVQEILTSISTMTQLERFNEISELRTQRS